MRIKTILFPLDAVISIVFLAGFGSMIFPGSSMAVESKVVVLPFKTVPEISRLDWLASSLPKQISRMLLNYGLRVDTGYENDPEVFEELSKEDIAKKLAESGYEMAVSGKIQQSTGSLQLSGTIFDNDGNRKPYFFSGKTVDVAQLVNEPSYLIVEIIQKEPVKKFRSVKSMPPKIIISEMDFIIEEFISREEFAQSESFYRSAVNIDPGNADAYYQLGVLYGRAGRMDDSIKLLQEAVKRASKYPEYHAALGTAYYLNGNLDDAVGELLQSTMIDENYADGFYYLSRIYRKIGDIDEAESYLDYMEAINPDYYLLKFGRAMIDFYGGHKEDAQRKFKEALVKNPRFSEAYNNLGVLLMERGDMENASKEFAKALAADRNNVMTMNNMAVFKLREGKLNEAVESLKDTISRYPDMSILYYNLGCIYQMRGDLKEALKHYLKALEKNPRSGDALINTGVARYLMCDFEGAQEAFENSTETNYTEALGQYNIGVIHNLFGRKKESLTNYIVANKKSYNIPEAHINLGLIYEEMSFDRKALTEYLKTLSLTDMLPEVYLYLGNIYYKLGYPELALETVKKSTLVSFSDPTAYYFLGQMLENSDKTEAVKYYGLFLKNIVRDPNRGPLWRDSIEQKIKFLEQ